MRLIINGKVTSIGHGKLGLALNYLQVGCYNNYLTCLGFIVNQSLDLNV